jgi:recombinational DNA repair protein (RecF pathway)
VNHIYTTKAFIIKSQPTGEANKLYFLLTRDLGFIIASAQGIRLDKSKLKGHLTDFSLVNISVVRGKSMWRIIGVDTIQQNIFKNNKQEMLVLKNISSLLLRLLHGEDKNEELFNVIEYFHSFLLKNRISSNELQSLETIIVSRILYQLGYFKKDFGLSGIIHTNNISEEMLNSFNDKRREVIKEINNALNDTSL